MSEKLRTLGITHEDLARQLGLSKSDVSNRLRDPTPGKRTRPTRWTESQLNGLRALVSEAAPWPLSDETTTSLVRSSSRSEAAERLERYYREAKRTPASLFDAQALADRASLWSNAVCEAIVRQVEVAPSTPTPAPRAVRRTDGAPRT